MRLRHHTLLNMVCNRLGRSPGVNSWPLVACATVSVWGCVGVVACAFLTCPYLRRHRGRQTAEDAHSVPGSARRYLRARSQLAGIYQFSSSFLSFLAIL